MRVSVGDVVEIEGNRRGRTMYVGDVDFADGEWVGIELLSPNGKHNGIVKGKRYFKCKPLCGVFVRRNKINRKLPNSIGMKSGVKMGGRPHTPTGRQRSPAPDGEEQQQSGRRIPGTRNYSSYANHTNAAAGGEEEDEITIHRPQKNGMFNEHTGDPPISSPSQSSPAFDHSQQTTPTRDGGRTSSPVGARKPKKQRFRSASASIVKAMSSSGATSSQAPLATWTSGQVAHWVRSVDKGAYKSYANAFELQSIDGEALASLSFNQWASLVPQVTARTAIRRASKRIVGSPPARRASEPINQSRRAARVTPRRTGHNAEQRRKRGQGAQAAVGVRRPTRTLTSRPHRSLSAPRHINSTANSDTSSNGPFPNSANIAGVGVSPRIRNTATISRRVKRVRKASRESGPRRDVMANAKFRRSSEGDTRSEGSRSEGGTPRAERKRSPADQPKGRRKSTGTVGASVRQNFNDGDNVGVPEIDSILTKLANLSAKGTTRQKTLREQLKHARTINNDASPSTVLRPGVEVEVYSRSKRQWVSGRIKRLDHDRKRATVTYRGREKTFSFNSEHIRLKSDRMVARTGGAAERRRTSLDGRPSARIRRRVATNEEVRRSSNKTTNRNDTRSSSPSGKISPGSTLHRRAASPRTATRAAKRREGSPHTTTPTHSRLDHSASQQSEAAFQKSVGDRIYPIVRRYHSSIATEVTAKLLQSTKSDLHNMLASDELLLKKINQAAAEITSSNDSTPSRIRKPGSPRHSSPITMALSGDADTANDGTDTRESWAAKDARIASPTRTKSATPRSSTASASTSGVGPVPSGRPSSPRLATAIAIPSDRVQPLTSTHAQADIDRRWKELERQRASQEEEQRRWKKESAETRSRLQKESDDLARQREELTRSADSDRRRSGFQARPSLPTPARRQAWGKKASHGARGKIVAVFQTMDLNNSNTLSHVEFRTALLFMNVKPEERDIDEIFDAMAADNGGAGRVNYHDFTDYLFNSGDLSPRIQNIKAKLLDHCESTTQLHSNTDDPYEQLSGISADVRALKSRHSSKLNDDLTDTLDDFLHRIHNYTGTWLPPSYSWTMEVSSSTYDDQSYQQCLSPNSSTGWFSDGADGQWVSFESEIALTLSKVSITNASPSIRNARFQYGRSDGPGRGNNDITWHDISTFTIPPNHTNHVLTFPAQESRYWRLYILDTHSFSNVTLNYIRFWGILPSLNSERPARRETRDPDQVRLEQQKRNEMERELNWLKLERKKLEQDKKKHEGEKRRWRKRKTRESDKPTDNGDRWWEEPDLAEMRPPEQRRIKFSDDLDFSDDPKRPPQVVIRQDGEFRCPGCDALFPMDRYLRAHEKYCVRYLQKQKREKEKREERARQEREAKKRRRAAARPADIQANIREALNRGRLNKVKQELPEYFEELDRRVVTSPIEIAESIPQLADFLSEDIDEDIKKVYCVYRWVTEFVSLDVDAMRARPSNKAEQSAERVLGSRLALPLGYANLFQALCENAGLKCEIINGWVKCREYRVGNSFVGKPTTYWNAVEVNGNSWLMVDCHMGAGSFSGKRFDKNFDLHYFCTEPDIFLWDHYPLESKHQFVSSAITQSDFENRAYVKSKFWMWKLQLLSHKQCVIRTESVEVITLGGAEYTDIFADIKPDNTNQAMRDLCFVQSDGNDFTVMARFPNRGDYELRIFAKPKSQRSNTYSVVLFYKVMVSRGAGDQRVVSFPKRFGSLRVSDSLESPLYGYLKSGKTYEFRMRSSAQRLKLKYGQKWIEMRAVEKDKQGRRLFVKKLEIDLKSSGDLLLLGQYPDEHEKKSTTYACLLKWVVM